MQVISAPTEMGSWPPTSLWLAAIDGMSKRFQTRSFALGGLHHDCSYPYTRLIVEQTISAVQRTVTDTHAASCTRLRTCKQKAWASLTEWRVAEVPRICTRDLNDIKRAHVSQARVLKGVNLTSHTILPEIPITDYTAPSPW